MQVRQCFNPCSNGMKKELIVRPLTSYGAGFNPCSNGMKKEPAVANDVAGNS